MEGNSLVFEDRGRTTRTLRDADLPAEVSHGDISDNAADKVQVSQHVSPCHAFRQPLQEGDVGLSRRQVPVVSRQDHVAAENICN